MNEFDNMGSVLNINGWPVWYEKIGSGSKPLLLIPDGIGTGRSDYWLQLEEDEALDQKRFTIIAVDSPGWGRSRPPARKYGNDVYNNDAECFYKLMQHLGYKQFSVIGWSEGAKSALTLAINYPDAIDAMILIGATKYNSQIALKHLNSIIDIKGWSKQTIESYLRSYQNCDEIQEMWTKFVKWSTIVNQYLTEDMFKNRYHLIKSRVLLIFGEKDKITDLDQNMHLRQKIKGSKLWQYPNGGHDYHQKNPVQFKKLAEEYLLCGTVTELSSSEVSIQPYLDGLINTPSMFAG